MARPRKINERDSPKTRSRRFLNGVQCDREACDLCGYKR